MPDAPKPAMHRIKTLNAISSHGLNRFPKDEYQIGSDVEDADAWLVRSADLHQQTIPVTMFAKPELNFLQNNLLYLAPNVHRIGVMRSPQNG